MEHIIEALEDMKQWRIRDLERLKKDLEHEQEVIDHVLIRIGEIQKTMQESIGYIEEVDEAIARLRG